MTKSNSKSNNRLKKYLPWLILGLIVIVAIFFRFYKIDSLPPGLHPDEAANGMDIFRILEDKDWRILYNTNGPRESLFFFLQAIFVSIIGNTILALRLAPAIIGVLTVLATFAWARDWFGRRIGLIAAAVAAINVWAITITRDGFRASMTPLMVALVMLFIGRAIKTKKLVYFILSGVAFGLGLYTYTAFLMLAVAAVMVGIYCLIARRVWIKENLAGLGVMFVTVAIIAAPLAYLFVAKPNESPLTRASGTSFLNKDLNRGNPVTSLATNTAKTLLQFNFRGDENPRHNTPGEPLLDGFVGIMFIVGVIIALSHLNHPKYFALLAVFGAMLLTGITTSEGIPHGLRTIGAAPAAFILAAIGINYIIFSWYKSFPINKPARLVGLYLIIGLLGLSTIKAYKQYFVAWAQDPRTFEAYSEDAVSAGNYLINNNNSDRKNYVYGEGYTLLPTEYLTHKKADYTKLNLAELEALPIDGQQRLILIISTNQQANQKVIEILKAKYPDGKLAEQYSPNTKQLLFYTFEVGS